jgi:hypothetical protein
MKMNANLRGVTIILAVGLTLLTSAASVRAARGPSPAQVTKAIQVAWAKFGNSAWLAPFPRQPARTACQIPAGGVGPGGSVPGYCETSVVWANAVRLYVTVAFTETWDASAFNGQGVPTTGPLNHTWLVIETAKLRPIHAATYGDFPPQWVR